MPQYSPPDADYRYSARYGRSHATLVKANAAGGFHIIASCHSVGLTKFLADVMPNVERCQVFRRGLARPDHAALRHRSLRHRMFVAARLPSVATKYFI
jgi:hypothetical protein